MYPRWLSLLILGVLGYLLVTGMGHKSTPAPGLPVAVPTKAVEAVTPASPTPETATTTNPAYAKLNEAADVEHWKRAINPQYAVLMARCELPKTTDMATLRYQVINEQEGRGAPAQCAEPIRAKFTVWNNHGRALYEGESDMKLGRRDIAVGMDAALVGMRIGAVRTVILPPALLEHAKDSPAPKALLRAMVPGNVAIVTVTRL